MTGCLAAINVARVTGEAFTTRRMSRVRNRESPTGEFHDLRKTVCSSVHFARDDVVDLAPDLIDIVESARDVF